MKRILALFALLFATAAFGVDNPISCTGLPCRVTIFPKSTTGTTVSGLYVDGSVAINSTNVQVGGPATTANTGTTAFNPTITIGATDGGSALNATRSYGYQMKVGEGDINGYDMVWYELDKGGTTTERMRLNRNAAGVQLAQKNSSVLSGVTNRNPTLILKNTDTGFIANSASAIDFSTNAGIIGASIIAKYSQNGGAGDGGALLFATDQSPSGPLQVVGSADQAGLWTLGASGGTQTHVVNGNMLINSELVLAGSSSGLAASTGTFSIVHPYNQYHGYGDIECTDIANGNNNTSSLVHFLRTGGGGGSVNIVSTNTGSGGHTFTLVANSGSLFITNTQAAIGTCFWMMHVQAGN